MAEPPIRPLTPEDAPRILALAAGNGVFTPAEVAVVDELLSDALSKGPASEYLFLVCGPPGEVLGFVCYGPTPMTEGTFDLYWIATGITAQGRGIGSRLLEATEAAVRRAGGRLLVIETSSLASYAPARRLYERHGYTLAARLADLYADGDDRLIYTKRLRQAE